jgi:AraC-like DNA-binding protein
MAVQAVLDANGIRYRSIELGRVQLPSPLTDAEKPGLIKGLAHYHLELMEDHSSILVERIKTEIISLLQPPYQLHIKLSAHLSGALGYNYTYLANVFSQEEGMTLEKYFILQRVERVKELIVYEDLSLAQIIDELNYSSVSHLCVQFKKVTGLTPAEFRRHIQSDDFVWRQLN